MSGSDIIKRRDFIRNTAASAAAIGLGATAMPSLAENKKPKVTYYRVKNGDSLWGIARKFRVSPQELKKWNNLKSNLIHPGKQLVVREV